MKDQHTYKCTVNFRYNLWGDSKRELLSPLNKAIRIHSSPELTIYDLEGCTWVHNKSRAENQRIYNTGKILKQ